MVNLPQLRPQRVLCKVSDVNEEMANAQAVADSLYKQAEADNRGLTDDEFAAVDQHMEYYKYLSEKELPRVEQMEAAQRKAARQIVQNNMAPHRLGTVNSGTAAANYQPRVNLIRRDLKVFNPKFFGGDAERATHAAEQCGHWFRAHILGNRDSIQYCRDNNLALGKWDEKFDAQTVDDATKGGVFVPTIVARMVLDVRDRVSIIAANARRYPMQGETDVIPKRDGGLTVYKPGEDTAITSSEKTSSGVTATTTDAYTLTHISHKLMRGSVVDAADQVVNEIGYAFAAQQDYEGINGDGTAGTPNFGITGIINGMSAASTFNAGGTTWADIDADTIRTLVGTLPDRFHGRNNTGGRDDATTSEAVFVCSRTFWANRLEEILEAGGGNNKFDISASTPYQLKGYPVLFTEEMPTAEASASIPLIFGNFFDGMLLAEREQVSIASSSDFRFDYDQMTVRGRISYDIQYHETGDGSNAGAFVGVVSSV